LKKRLKKKTVSNENFDRCLDTLIKEKLVDKMENGGRKAVEYTLTDKGRETLKKLSRKQIRKIQFP